MTANCQSQLNRCRILIVDDHPIVRRGLRDLLTDEPDLEVCGEAEDVSEALQQMADTQPDLVIVDLSLRSGHGLDLIRQIKSRSSNTKILVSTIHDECLYAERSLRAGASGFINKQESPDKIIHAVRDVLRGNIYVSSRMANRLLTQLARGRQAGDDPISSLTDREFEILEMIARGEGTKQIAAELTLSPKTIETYRERMKTKLNLGSATELRSFAIQWLLESKNV